jgi:hypothetical protein
MQCKNILLAQKLVALALGSCRRKGHSRELGWPGTRSLALHYDVLVLTFVCSTGNLVSFQLLCSLLVDFFFCGFSLIIHSCWAVETREPATDRCSPHCLHGPSLELDHDYISTHNTLNVPPIPRKKTQSSSSCPRLRPRCRFSVRNRQYDCTEKANVEQRLGRGW